MSILSEIQAWAVELPAWQQDAITRLFSKGELSAADDDDLYALLKNENGIPDSQGRTAKKLATDQIAAPLTNGKLVQLSAIRDLRHVNALAENQCLSFAPTGLTVIYGDNGSGKSGYSRALKRACRARDQSEPILPNASLTPDKVGNPEAAFDLLIDGATAYGVKWTDGTLPPVELAAISIFDAHCARAYLDEEGDFSYAPYGLDILSGLAQLCNRLKAKIENEQEVMRPNVAAISHLAEAVTLVGQLIATLSAKTKPEDVVSLATLSTADIERHTELSKALKEENPKEKAAQLRLRATRFEALANRSAEKCSVVSDMAVANLSQLIQQSNAAKEAAALAAKQFTESPGQLPGTGGEAWQKLFEAARAFATESHPHRQFPELAPDDQCPLCQNPLGEAASRLVQFEKFITQEVEKEARAKRVKAIEAFEAVTKADLSIGFDAAIQEELKTVSPELFARFEEFGKKLAERVGLIRSACAPNGDWAAIGAAPEDPGLALRVLANVIKQEAEALEKASDDKVRAQMDAQFKELDARIRLGQVKDVVLDVIERYRLQASLTKCLGGVKTTGISTKARDLTEKVVSKELEAALNDEFKRLNVGELHVCLRPFSVKGKTYYKLALELPGQQRPTMILSEGEQRAIAISSFLAEVNISGSKGTIVFDDPVSSLDHRRRWLVARRFVEEAAIRQVIVFTHDLYFLCLVQQEARHSGVTLSALALHRAPEGFGVCTDRLPFDGTPTQKRLNMLRESHVQCEKLHRNNDEAASSRLIRNAYGQLRETWERAVEEVLLDGVVTRFGEGISTQKLRGVEVLDPDYEAVEAGMTKCSKFASHDGAANANVPTPHPDELLKDIEACEVWRKAVEARKETTRKRRKI